MLVLLENPGRKRDLPESLSLPDFFSQGQGSLRAKLKKSYGNFQLASNWGSEFHCFLDFAYNSFLSKDFEPKSC
jgi:hypothetical protein